jgi:hypothetical protein
LSIPLIGLTHYTAKYLINSLDSICAVDGLDITIVDSHSRTSPLIKEVLDRYLLAGKIRRYVMCDVNCKGFGFQWAFNKFINPVTDPLCILTDMDVVPLSEDWLPNLKDSMKTNVMTCGTLDLKNYTNTPNSGHLDVSWGVSYWLMMMQSSIYAESLSYSNSEIFTLDGNLTSFFRNYGKVERSEAVDLKHLGWDIWKEYPEHWERKLAGINWFDVIPKDSDYHVYTR